MPYFVAQFSAVIAIGAPQCVSVSASHRVSSSFGVLPNLKPVRPPRTTCGAWLMLSMPPASTTEASPSWINCAPVTAAWIPDPHSRFTASAGVSTGTPLLSPMCRAA